MNYKAALKVAINAGTTIPCITHKGKPYIENGYFAAALDLVNEARMGDDYPNEEELRKIEDVLEQGLKESGLAIDDGTFDFIKGYYEGVLSTHRTISHKEVYK